MLSPNVPSPPRSTSKGEVRSGSSPTRLQVRPASRVIHNSTTAGPFGPASSTAYWTLNRGLETSIVRLPPMFDPPGETPAVGDPPAVPGTPDAPPGSTVGNGSGNPVAEGGPAVLIARLFPPLTWPPSQSGAG